MRSIRLSLVLYFLALVVAALGGVSLLVYRLTSATLEEKERSSRELIEAQCASLVQEARDDVDRRLMRQARALASVTRTSMNHFEGLYPFGMLSAVLQPQGHLFVPLWLAEAANPALFLRLVRMRALDFEVENPEAVLPSSDDLFQPQEYYQLFRTRGQPVLKSDTLGAEALPLSEDLLEKTALGIDEYDVVTLPSGLKLRRVTTRAHVLKIRAHTFSFPWRLQEPPPPKFSFFGKRPPPGPQPGPPQGGPHPWSFNRFKGYETVAPEVIVQYACDIAPLEEHVAALEKSRNERLQQLEHETDLARQALGRRLTLIGLLTTICLLCGGFMLVRLGLAPLTRLTEAVGEVSEKDFRLKIDDRSLPEELQPIADRLSGTLHQLQKAFDREKQAAADISHELRTPLAALLTTLEVALKKQRTQEEYRELLEDCRSSGAQMMHLVERLLALARLDAGADRLRKRTIDAGDLAHQCADLVRPLADAKGIDLRVHAEPEMVLEADPDKLREVLTNLLHNAVEYNKPAGSIDLEVEKHPGHVDFTVRDTGIGIAEEAREHIFERFYRADPSRHADTPHAGLGLSIVKSYVDLMGGNIFLESSDAGSTFRVTLPSRG